MKLSSMFIVMTLAVVLAMVVVVEIESVSAKEFIVGDDKGWTVHYDYDAWSSGKEFRVGDKLVFKYKKGAHNVFDVDASTWFHCITPPIENALSSGHDVITLTSPGIKYYMCGVGNHCEHGNQKVAVTVLSPLAHLAPLSPQHGLTSFANGPSSHGFHLWMLIGAYIVFNVDALSWLNCIPPPAAKAFSSGYDVINLTSPGTKWYMCGVGNHCEVGNQRLDIIVLSSLLPQAPTSPEEGAATSSTNSSIGQSSSHGHLWMLIALYILLIMILD